MADTPDGARIDHRLQQLLIALHHDAGGAVALISGRSLADIDRLFPDVALPAAGQHGVERRGVEGRMSHHAFPSRRLDTVRERLVDAVHRHPGLLVEDKGLSVALHYRRAPQLAAYAQRLAAAMLHRLGSRYTIQVGKCVVEIKPAGKDKGVAILEFMHEAPFCGRTPVFVGDDATDEYGFAMVNRLGGRSVKVGPGATVAHERLPDVRAVREWLEHRTAGAHA